MLHQHRDNYSGEGEVMNYCVRAVLYSVIIVMSSCFMLVAASLDQVVGAVIDRYAHVDQRVNKERSAIIQCTVKALRRSGYHMPHYGVDDEYDPLRVVAAHVVVAASGSGSDLFNNQKFNQLLVLLSQSLQQTQTVVSAENSGSWIAQVQDPDLCEDQQIALTQRVRHLIDQSIQVVQRKEREHQKMHSMMQKKSQPKRGRAFMLQMVKNFKL